MLFKSRGLENISHGLNRAACKPCSRLAALPSVFHSVWFSQPRLCCVLEGRVNRLTCVSHCIAIPRAVVKGVVIKVSLCDSQVLVGSTLNKYIRDWGTVYMMETVLHLPVLRPFPLSTDCVSPSVCSSERIGLARRGLLNTIPVCLNLWRIVNRNVHFL